MRPVCKLNTLALISFISGLMALLSIGTIFAFYNLTDLTDSILFIFVSILTPVRNLAVIMALVSGILALIDIKKKGGVERCG